MITELQHEGAKWAENQITPPNAIAIPKQYKYGFRVEFLLNFIKYSFMKKTSIVFELKCWDKSRWKKVSHFLGQYEYDQSE